MELTGFKWGGGGRGRAGLKINVYVRNLKPAPNKLNTKFSVSEDLFAFLYSQEKCIFMPEMYRPPTTIS